MAQILIVDDSKMMREMIIACLRPLPGATFTHAASGLEAIEKLSIAPFDLAVVDLNMPDVGGIEVVAFVRGQDKLSAMPIIIVTTRGDAASQAQAAKSGATRYMTKPFDPTALLEAVGALLPVPVEAA